MNESTFKYLIIPLKVYNELFKFVTEHFEERGVTCCFDNTHVASSVHLLFLCVLPSQLPSVAEELRGHLSPRTLVYSFVTGTPLGKLKQLLEHESVIAATWRWDDEQASTWELNLGVKECFGRSTVIGQTFPLHGIAANGDLEGPEESKPLSHSSQVKIGVDPPKEI